MLLTRPPVAAKSIATLALPLGLHVLSLSLAFILSQDQTLRCISFLFFFIPDISCSYALIDDVDAVTSFLICFHISSRTYFVFAAYLYWFSPCFQ